MLTHKLHTLDSGLTVITVPMASVQSVTVMVFSNTGSRYEEPQEEGIAHFFEHMVFKGTASYPTAQELAAAVDGVGADFNAFTSKEYTGYYVKAASRHTSLALDVLSDMLLTPRLRQDDIDREKLVIMEEMNMYADTPARHIADIFENMMFNGSGLGHDVIGNKTTVNNITAAHFDKFLRQWYGLGNVVVVVAGDATVVDGTDILDKVSTAFSKNSVARAADRVKIDHYLSANPMSTDKLNVTHKATEQAHFIVGFPGISRQDERKVALNVLGVLLGGTMSSRLFSEIREKRGLCYYVHTDVDLYHDTGVFGASAGVDPARVQEALAATLDEFMALKTNAKPVTEAELARAKEYLLGKTVLGLEDSDSVAQFYGLKQLLMGKVETPDEVQAKIKAVTLNGINDLIDQLIQPDQLRLAVIGPYQDQQPFTQTMERIL